MKGVTLTLIAAASAGTIFNYDSCRSSHEANLYVTSDGALSLLSGDGFFPILNDDGQLADNWRKKYVVVGDNGVWKLLSSPGEGKFSKGDDGKLAYTDKDGKQLQTAVCSVNGQYDMASVDSEDKRLGGDGDDKCSKQSICIGSEREHEDVKVDDQDHSNDEKPQGFYTTSAGVEQFTFLPAATTVNAQGSSTTVYVDYYTNAQETYKTMIRSITVSEGDDIKSVAELVLAAEGGASQSSPLAVLYSGDVTSTGTILPSAIQAQEGDGEGDKDGAEGDKPEGDHDSEGDKPDGDDAQPPQVQPAENQAAGMGYACAAMAAGFALLI